MYVYSENSSLPQITDFYVSLLFKVYLTISPVSSNLSISINILRSLLMQHKLVHHHRLKKIFTATLIEHSIKSSSSNVVKMNTVWQYHWKLYRNKLQLHLQIINLLEDCNFLDTDHGWVWQLSTKHNTFFYFFIINLFEPFTIKFSSPPIFFIKGFYCF